MSLIVYIIAFAFFIYCWWRIIGKMGFSGFERVALVGGSLIPVIGLIFVLFYLALFDWPVHKDYEKLKQRIR